MTWIRIDDQMPDHPKIEPLSDAAFRWTIRALSYANRFLTNGVLPSAFLDRVPDDVRGELVTRGVWEQGRDGHTRIHDYLDYQPSKAEIQRQRKATRQRVARFREREKEPRPAQSRNAVTNAVTNAVSNGAPVPSRPTPPRPSRGTKESPPIPPFAGGATPPISTRKLSKDERESAMKVRSSWRGCQHDPGCENYDQCIGRIGMDHRLAMRRGMQQELAQENR